jgi:alkyl hydroperoxide reductase subunit D
MDRLEALRACMPEAARDIKLNLQSVLASGGPLGDTQRWGVAAAAAFAAGDRELAGAIVAVASEVAGARVVDDARAAAALMAMNNIYYRFRHIVGKASYSQMPARLRMNRMAQAVNRVDFELFSLAVSAMSGCEACVRAHEQAVIANGLSEEQVHEAVRIAATVQAAAVALAIAEVEAPAAAIAHVG